MLVQSQSRDNRYMQGVESTRSGDQHCCWNSVDLNNIDKAAISVLLQWLTEGFTAKLMKIERMPPSYRKSEEL